MGRWSADVGAEGAEGAAPRSLFQVYDEDLVPLVFRSYADDLAARLDGLAAGAVLETAAGTGVLTRLLAAALRPEVAITATDLVPGMVERAQSAGTVRPVAWEVANALDLPYDDGSFDVVVCAFGAMFFAPHAAAFAEARRVLRPGGRLLFTVWDRLEANEFSATVDAALRVLHPEDTPGFLGRTPYGYADPDTIVADLVAGGFTAGVGIERLEHRSVAADAVVVARALCAGTPLRDELTRRGPGVLDATIAAIAECLAARFGATDLEGRTSALLVETRR